MAVPFFYKKSVSTDLISADRLTWVDQSSNALDIILSDAGIFSFGTISTGYEPALIFNGVDESGDGGTGIPDLETGSSIAIWLQADDLAPALRATALTNTDSDGIECGIQLSSGGDIVCKFEIPSLFGASGPLPDTGLHLVILTFSGSVLLLYIDGVLQSGTTQGVTTGADKLIIGARTDLAANQFWDGGIRDIQILNRIIGAVEALDRFENPQLYPLLVDQWATQLISGWTNQGFATFTSSGVDITQAVSDAVSDLCYSALSTDDGIEVLINFFVTVNAGTVGDLRFRVTSNILSADQTVNHTVTAGQNTIRYTSVSTDAFCGFVDIAGSTPKIDFAVSGFKISQEGVIAHWKLEHTNAFSPLSLQKARFVPINEQIIPNQIFGKAGGGQLVIDDLGDAEQLFPQKYLRISAATETNVRGFFQDPTVNYSQETFTWVEEDASEHTVRLWPVGQFPNPIRGSGGLFNIDIGVREEI